MYVKYINTITYTCPCHNAVKQSAQLVLRSVPQLPKEFKVEAALRKT